MMSRKVYGFFMKTPKDLVTYGPQKSVWQRMTSQWELYLFLLPAVVFLIIFNYVPMYGITLAFKDYSVRKGIMGSDWIGMEHFIRFFNSPKSWEMIKNTVSISLTSTLLSFPIPIIFAILLHQIECKWFKKSVQNMTYIPYMLSVVIIISIARVFCDLDSGVFNIILKAMGKEQILFFAEPDYVFWIYWLTGIWQTMGYSAVLYLAALSGVDQEQLEAAKIDGANRLRVIWNIELPAISETIIIMLIMAFGSVFAVSADKMILIKNPMNVEASEVIATYVYENGIMGREKDYTTAIGLFNTLVGVVSVLIVNKIASVVSDTSLF